MPKTKTKNERLVSVTLPRIGGKNNAVYVSVGDRSWRILRGATVQIPECAYDVLCNAQIADDAAVAYMESVL